jgi:hypothetical protein
MPKLLAFYSSAMGSGKTTAARYLIAQHQYECIRFAGPLKSMLCALLKSTGYTHGEAMEFIDGPLKESPIPRLMGFTPRRLMQTLGTEWARESLHKDLWVNATREAIEPLVNAGRAVVIDDLRYRNEAHMVMALGGKIIRIDREVAEVTAAHPSEGELQNWSPDFVVENNESLEALQADLSIIASSLK